MKILVDAFGGDNAPLEIIKGAVAAAADFTIANSTDFSNAANSASISNAANSTSISNTANSKKTVIALVGDEQRIKSCAAENGIDISMLEIITAPDVISVDDDVMEILKEKSQSSMAVGLRALAEGRVDAFVSAGSTGALVVGGTFIVKRIKGVKRAAIASVMPSLEGPFMLIDSGANLEVKPKYLDQFALMGSLYMQKVLKIKNPRVGLANIGTEECKGTELCREAYSLMAKQSSYNFTGNAEVRDIPYGVADVIVADGFTGNVILKMYEGVAGAMMKSLKGIFKKSKFTMLGALFVKSGLSDFKARMDYKKYGGAPLMGLSRPVIKAHGSSDAEAIKNAVKAAVSFAETGVIEDITAAIKAARGEEKDD